MHIRDSVLLKMQRLSDTLKHKAVKYKAEQTMQPVVKLYLLACIQKINTQLDLHSPYVHFPNQISASTFSINMVSALQAIYGCKLAYYA